ncbi:hypothetical protein [Flavobacterium degerlachei]|jgi:hypothetical protein|uniref:Uncharacterized protein n=1 Tax=Flavobacterium degerlachei TaxID=229203 RepID=A0A1H2YXU8_9FLAO|nr:hypothetical protein [Flavobacterium degerlachei]SDX09885.1 hypothetical protein SAMN05444338_10726 [Flavobacterium degerlachei]
MEQTKTNAWFEKNWLVIILCVIFFPVGLYALWKNSTISKGWKIGLTTVIAIVVIASLTDDKTTSNENIKENNETEIDSKKNENLTEKNPNITALEEIKKEPKVKEAMITDANVLYVSVKDDGTNRNGFAQYLCEILNEYKATTKWVKVVKVNSINDPNSDNAYGILLGESNCN